MGILLETDSLDPPLDLPLENLGGGAQISASLTSPIGGGVISSETWWQEGAHYVKGEQCVPDREQEDQ